MKYHNITKDDMLNGDGLRVVLWVAGCEHRCKNCQNPVTWDCEDGLNFGEAEEAEIRQELEKDYVSGITFSGGDPLHPKNVEEVTRLAKRMKDCFPDKTIWLYTGYTWREVRDFEVFQYVDVCVDGKYIEELRDEKLLWKGSSNQQVINVQETLKQKDVNNIILHAPNYEEGTGESSVLTERKCCG